MTTKEAIRAKGAKHRLAMINIFGLTFEKILSQLKYKTINNEEGD